MRERHIFHANWAGRQRKTKTDYLVVGQEKYPKSGHC